MNKKFCSRRNWLRRASLLASVCTLSMFFLSAASSEEEKNDGVIKIGSRRELFLDDLMIDRLENLQRRMHHPIPQEVSLVHDAPWEGTGSGYHCVFQDGHHYRMYYHGAELKLTGTHQDPVLCVAESADGIHWMASSNFCASR